MKINGREYEFADVSVIGGGKDIIGLRGIKYTAKQEKELLYGKGNQPASIQHGNKSYDGELSVLQSELETMIASVASHDLMDLRINMAVCYGNPSKGEPMVTDRIYNLEFTEAGKELKQGDKNQEIALPFIATKIDYNV